MERTMPITILVAPAGFKESLSAKEAADAIARGARAALPSARIISAPIVDGGEGFTQALVDATGGTIHPVTVTGPVGEGVAAHVGFLGGTPIQTAVVELAAAAGLRLVPATMRDPTRTTSYGLGELIKTALDLGAEHILVGCGDSGVNDGGTGMARALGVRFLDDVGSELHPGGGDLHRLARIDLSNLDYRIARTRIEAAVNWHNVLLGPRGVARVFGPQKGATPDQVLRLERGLDVYAGHLRAITGHCIATTPGSGASGGVGAGLSALLGARLRPWHEIVLPALNLDELMQSADLVVTAEGRLDGQTRLGKVPCAIAKRARQHEIPVIALAGAIGEDAAEALGDDICAYTSILQHPCAVSEAIDHAPDLLAQAAEQAIRMVLAGIKVAGKGRVASSKEGKPAPHAEQP
jgi:glycerate kinase